MEIKDITDLDRPKNCSQSTGHLVPRVLSYPSHLREMGRRENLGTRFSSGMVTS